MSKIGEATGGHGRFFGGIARVEVLKTMWFPVTTAIDMTAWNTLTPCALINGAADDARISGWIPSNFQPNGYTARLAVVGMANVAAMHMNLETYSGADGQAPNANGGVGEFGPFQTVNDIVDLLDIGAGTWGGGLGGPQPNRILSVRASYRAVDAHTATNLAVLGLILGWL